jgi:hypothetical protein
MNKLFKYSVLGLTAISLTTSCTKQLDLFPEDSIELTQSFKTMADANSWDLGNYNRFRGLQYGSYAIYADVQSDMVNATLDYGNRNGNPHRWGQSFLSDDQTLRPIWAGYYNVIANANLAIQNLSSVTAPTVADKALINRYLGNAYFTRAFCYSELVKRFAKAYNPTSANSDLGVPLVLTYNVASRPARATMKAVYDQILADINLAKTNLATVNPLIGATQFNRNTPIALEARVRLMMQDWAGAHTAAETILAAGTYPLATTQAIINAMWKTDASNEVIYRPAVSAPNELPATIGGVYLGLIPATGRFAPDFLPSQWVVDSFENADFRKLVYFAQLNLTIQGSAVNSVWCVNKFPGNPALFTTANTNYAHQPRVFTVSELFLISAEAGARSGNPALVTQATTRYNQLRAARGVSAFAGSDLFAAVRNERFREMAFQGERLWDLKRWNMPCVRSSPQNLSIILTNPAASFHQLNIAANNDQFTWGIPSWDIIANPNLVQNPGW